MPTGPGKYDDLTTLVRERAGAEGVIVLIHHGKLGNGFEVQGTLAFQLGVPELLREIADQIEATLAGN